MEHEGIEPVIRSVLGDVFVLETGEPIPDAEATVFDVSGPEADKAIDRELTEEDLGWIRSGLSLGSALTDDEGVFVVDYSDPPDTPQRQIVVVVTAAREASDSAIRTMYVSPRIRRSVALSEEFQIGVPSAIVAAAAEVPGKKLREAAEAAFSATRANRSALRNTLRSSIAARTFGLASARTKITAELRNRARKRFELPDGTTNETYVTDTSNVRQTQVKAFRKTLARIGSIRMEAEIDPDSDGRAVLVDDTGATVPGLTSADIRAMLFERSRNPAASDWAFHDKLRIDCRKRYLMQKFAPAGPGGDGPVGGPDDAEPSPATPEDVKRHLSSLLSEIDSAKTTDEDHEDTGTLAGINGFVHGLDIKGGAADQTAIFDFETLNFAFDHVWKDIFDSWWATVLADRAVEVGKFSRRNAGLPEDDAPKRDFLEELEFQTQTLQAATVAELGADGIAGVSYSIVGDALSGISSVTGAVADAAGAVVDIVTPGGRPPPGGRRPRDYRDRPRSGRGRVRDHRDRSRRRTPGKRMQILSAYLKALDDVLVADYPFTPFGTDSSGRAINYGQIVKYRQHWTPKSYQAGELVKTIPLAPRQKIAFSSTRTTRESYTEKRARASENTYNSEDTATTRDVAKIVNSAKLETAYTLENKANASVPGVGGGDSTTTFNTNFGLQSSRTKETFREQVRKESESFKNTTSINVETTQSSELVEEESSEIQNPNDEVAFTCLFYELQRRFEVSEKLHKLTPVILVAEEIWKPSEITPETVARYDWIIRRVLIDSSYEVGLDIISAGSLVAEQAGLADLEDMMEEQFGVVEDLRRQLQTERSVTITPRRRRRARSLVEIGLELVGLGGAEAPAAETDSVLDEEEQRENELEDELRRQEGLLSQAVERFNEAFTSYAEKAIQVKKLQLHVKENIVYYMQAIWDHEDNHQMLMRLRSTQVPVITGDVAYSVTGLAPHEEPPHWTRPIRLVARARDFQVSADTVDLAEVADLSRPLGFFGNYRIFPLTALNPVSEILAVPFLSGRAGVHDPDAASNVTVADLEAYTDCLRNTMDTPAFDAILPRILGTLERRLDHPRPDSEEIVIPTGSLFIELLPGKHSAMESFQRQHRGVDVADAVADVITKRLEHLRVAARIAADKLGDPTTEKVVVADPDVVDLDNL